MPVEFKLQDEENSSDSTRLAMMYDGSGRRISKTLLTKPATATSWETVKVTHYTGIGTEVREEFHNGTREKVNVVVNMPQGLGRYGIEDAADPFKGISLDENGKPTSWSALNPKFEWYLKNHLGSTMLVYGTVVSTDPNTADIGETKAAYDYRAFGEMVTLSQPSDKVTENFTGKELDDETKLSNHGARLLDPMIGMWITVDPKRQFLSPYLYAGNGYNPVNAIDEDGGELDELGTSIYNRLVQNDFWGSPILKQDWTEMKNSKDLIKFKYNVMDDGGQAYRNLKLIENNSKYKNSLAMTAITGRHEWDHLKGESGAGWHNDPKGKLFEAIDNINDVFKINEGLRDNSLSKELLDALGSKEFDPIYGKDFEVYEQVQEWGTKNEIKE